MGGGWSDWVIAPMAEADSDSCLWSTGKYRIDLAFLPQHAFDFLHVGQCGTQTRLCVGEVEGGNRRSSAGDVGISQQSNGSPPVLRVAALAELLRQMTERVERALAGCAASRQRAAQHLNYDANYRHSQQRQGQERYRPPRNTESQCTIGRRNGEQREYREGRDQISGSGAWQITNVTNTGISAGVPILVYLDSASATTSATLTKASTTNNNIINIDLFHNRVIVKHEGTSGTSTINADFAHYVSDDDVNIPFTANNGRLEINNDNELHIWGSTTPATFAPGGEVALVP